MAAEFHVGDFGTKLLVTVKDQDSDNYDLSSATIRFLFRKPDGTVIQKTGTYETDGTDALTYYVFESGVLDTEGTWFYQVKVDKSGKEFNSDYDKFRVFGSLRDF